MAYNIDIQTLLLIAEEICARHTENSEKKSIPRYANNLPRPLGRNACCGWSPEGCYRLVAVYHLLRFDSSPAHSLEYHKFHKRSHQHQLQNDGMLPQTHY